MIVGITGNIGSGKSTAVGIFKKHDYSIINADTIGHELYYVKSIKDKVVKTFGKTILTKGQIDRSKLKNIVFKDPKQLQKLNRITHPEIISQIKRRIRLHKKIDPKAKIVVEAALLIEFGFKMYDKLLLITIGRDIQVKRLQKKGKYNLAEINNIIDSQMKQEEKIKYADYIIDNSGSKKAFEINIKKLIKAIDND